MNKNEVSPKGNVRLNRIKTVSRIFRALLGLYAVAIILLFVGYAFAAMPNNPPGPQPVSFLLYNFFVKPHHVPVQAVLMEIVRLGLYGYGMILLNRLFSRFERGNFFTAENVRCVRWLGLVVVADWFAGFMLAVMSRWIVIQPGELLVGLFVVLISWIADEGRKIQEEQEFTI